MIPSGLTIRPLTSQHRFGPGDDLVDVLLQAAEAHGERLQDGDVVCVASKVVSLVEGGGVALPAGDARLARRALAREQATEIVAEAPWVVITRTPQGFVAANGGIDASNVPNGTALLLPEDPDASACRLHQELQDRTGRHVGVVVTDTFGRAWRHGQTDVALGVAGLPAIRDERGHADLDGHDLEVTEAAIADELAGAADLVRTKASGAPFVLIRGLTAGDGPPGSGQQLVRPVEQDLFRFGGPTAAERAVAARRTVRRFDPGQGVDDRILERAVAAAVTAPAPHGTRPWRFVRLTASTRTRLLDAMAAAWRRDLSDDGVRDEVIARRLRRSDEVLRVAPELLVPFVHLDEQHAYRDERRQRAERHLFLLSGGAGLQNLQVVLTAHGLGAAWISSTMFCADTVREELGLPASAEPLGMLAIGVPETPPGDRGAIDAADHLEIR